MAAMWRCPECETMNTEDKCVVCGCSKPKSVNNTYKSNIVQEQLKINNANQESLKSIQNGNQYKNKNQYKIDNQQDSINFVKTHTPNRKKKNKKIPIIIVSCITLIFVAGVSLGVIKNYVDITYKREAGLPDVGLSTDVSYSLTQMTTDETTIPVSEEETTTTIVPESVTENVVEEDMLVMPSLMKKDYSTAIKILDTIGLQYRVTYSEKKYVDIDENCVYSQKPATGSLVKRDTIVEIGISTYKSETVTTTTPSTTPPPISITPIGEGTANCVKTPWNETEISERSDISEHTREWNETEISETLYIKIPCYSRIKAVVGADAVKRYKVGTKINVVAATDTGFYKLDNGTFIHSDYVTDENPNTMVQDSYIPEPSTDTKSDTSTETVSEKIDLNGDITIFSTFNSYTIDNFPIEGTTWQDYYWTSDNESCVQFISGMLVTYFEGEATITLTYISDPSIVATAKIRVVS